MEKVTFGKRTLKVLGVVACIFVLFIAILSLYSVIKDWEFRVLLTDVLVTITTFIVIGFVINIVYLIWAYITEQEKGAIGKAVGIILILGAIAGTLFILVFGFFSYAFMKREERTAYIDNQKYVARRETWGWETVGMSYHKIHGIFCEREGWEIEFDYKLWDSYR